MTGSAALFLDRDGVINVDHGHVGSLDRWEFMPGIFDVCRVATFRRLKLLVVTNQAGIARGYYSEKDFLELTEWMKRQFDSVGAPITDVYFCPYHATEGLGLYRAESSDRKPAPGMLLRAAREHGLDLSRSVFLGDTETDMQAGKAAGVARLVLLAKGGRPTVTLADFVITDLKQAIALLPEAGPF